MSHFTVLVIGEDHDKQLAPFQENNMGDCPTKYLEFHETETEMLKEYENEGTERIIMSNGRKLLPWDKEFQNADAFGIGGNSHTVPEDLERREIPYKETYPTFEAFVEDWHGSEERDAEKGVFGYWENPNKKWDWYQVGGRWTGAFKLKLNGTGKLGTPSWAVKDDKPEAGWVDQAHKKDIDFDVMIGTRITKAEETWKEYQFALLEAGKLKGEEQEKAKRSAVVHNLGLWENPNITKEEFLKKRSCFNTFAVLKDGMWYERGKMGWWGIVADEKDGGAWGDQWTELVMNLPGETLLTIVDCHI